MTLAAEEFRKDPRIIEARSLIRQAVEEHQKKLNCVKSPDSDKKVSYESLLKNFSEIRGGNLYYPYLASGLGHGALVELLDGSIKYDFISGIGVHSWGHSAPDIIDTGISAAIEDTVMQGNLQQSQASFELSKLFIDGANRKGDSFKHCILSTSGAMADENALKLLFHKKQPATKLLVFEKCFMGRTLALAQCTDKPAYRIGLPATLDIDYVPFYDAGNPELSIKKSAEILEEHLKRYPDQYAGMSFELIQGEGGYYPGTREFFVCLLEILKKYEVPILIDEIQTFGRTTELFAFQYFDLGEYADIVTIGKQSQVCATLYKANFKPAPGLISQTFTASSSAIQASLFIVKSLLNDGYLGKEGKISELSAFFREQLQALSDKYPGKLKGPFGLGAMLAFTVFDGSLEKTKKFVFHLFEAGVIAFMAGAKPTRCRFLPPMGVLTKDDIIKAMKIIEKTLIEI